MHNQKELASINAFTTYVDCTFHGVNADTTMNSMFRDCTFVACNIANMMGCCLQGSTFINSTLTGVFKSCNMLAKYKSCNVKLKLEDCTIDLWDFKGQLANVDYMSPGNVFIGNKPTSWDAAEQESRLRVPRHVYRVNENIRLGKMLRIKATGEERVFTSLGDYDYDEVSVCNI